MGNVAVAVTIPSNFFATGFDDAFNMFGAQLLVGILPAMNMISITMTIFITSRFVYAAAINMFGAQFLVGSLPAVNMISVTVTIIVANLVVVTGASNNVFTHLLVGSIPAVNMISVTVTIIVANFFDSSGFVPGIVQEAMEQDRLVVGISIAAVNVGGVRENLRFRPCRCNTGDRENNCE